MEVSKRDAAYFARAFALQREHSASTAASSGVAGPWLRQPSNDLTLGNTSILSSLQDTLALAAKTLAVPYASAWVPGEDRQWECVAFGCETEALRPLQAVVAMCAAQREPLVVTEWNSDPRFNLACTKLPLEIGSLMAAPLLSATSEVIGCILLADSASKPNGLGDQHRSLLDVFASMAAARADACRERAAREEAERRLEVCRDSYERAIAAGSQMPWAADAEGRLIEVSPRWVELTGRTREQLLGFGWREFFKQSDLDRIDAALAEKADVVDVKFRADFASGGFRWIRIRAQAQRDEAGNFSHWCGVIEDVHDHELAVEALRESEEHHRYSVELSPQIPWTAEPDGRIREFSSSFAQSIGQSDADIIDHGWTRILHPDDCEPTLSTWQHCLRTGTPVDIEYRIRMGDGEYRWFRARAAPRRDVNGVIVRWYGTSEDIHDRKLAEEALRESEEHHRSAIELSPQIPWVAGPDGQIIEVSPRWYELTNLGPETGPVQWADLLYPGDETGLAAAWTRSLATGEPYDCEYRIRMANGDYRWFRSRAVPRRDGNGNIVRWYGSLEDIHDRKQAEEALRESEERFRLAARAAGLGICDYDADSGRLELSDELRELLGLAPEAEASIELMGELIHPADLPVFSQLIGAIKHGEISGQYGETLRIRRADNGEVRWLATAGWESRANDGQLSRVLITVLDITNEKVAAEHIHWAARHDPLTGLANRLEFQMQLNDIIEQAQGRNYRAGVLLVDMGSLKQINDTLGHATGDVLLRTFAARLQETVGDAGTVARLGGDEFAVALAPLWTGHALSEMVDLLLERLRQPVYHGEHTLEFRASIGASLYPDHGKDASSLLREADIALHKAKEAGRNRAVVFQSLMRTEVQRRETGLALARNALKENGILPFYQPKIDLRTGQLFGFEALLRWRHPYMGIQPPAGIAVAFEDQELAIALSERMMAMVAADMRTWLDQGFDFGHVAINASAAEFRQDGFAERMLAHLRAAGVDPSYCELEVTESVLLDRGSASVEQTLRSLSATGMRIAMDDFGTGYASLAHLKTFPVDTIKIDRSFVQDLEIDHSDAAIVRAILSLGQSLGIRIVAEGIETEAQVEFLQVHGCDFGQGYYFGRPSPANEVTRFMRYGAMPQVG